MEGWCRLELLGCFQVVHRDELLPVLPSAERLLALMALLHRERPVRRSTVAERLWPDSAPARAASNLRSVLWRLPRPRGRALVQGNATMMWVGEGLEVDLWAAEELAHRVSVSGPRTDPPVDLGLLHHDLLPGWSEDWLVLEQESYRQKRLHALERGAALLCEDGRFTDALAAGLDAVHAEPLRESAHRRVIQVHLAEGNHAEALRQYDGYRRLLARELGLPPSDSIRHLVAPLLGRPLDLG